MTGTRPFLALLGVAAIVLATLATWLVLHNPTIDGTSRGDDYDCLAPYDTSTPSAIYTAPASATDPHHWAIPLDAVQTITRSPTTAPAR